MFFGNAITSLVVINWEDLTQILLLRQMTTILWPMIQTSEKAFTLKIYRNRI
jgi:hypothetical protein